MSEEEANELQEELGQSAPHPLHAWDQQPGEPDEKYADFLIYLALGRGRTIDAAYKAKYVQMQQVSERNGKWDPLPAKNVLVRGQASGSFWQMQSQWHWMERAAKYDVYMLSQLVPQTVTEIFKAISAFAKVTREALEDGSVKPTNWQEAKGGVETIASYISPDIIQATVDHSGSTPGDDSEQASQAIIDNG